MTTEAIRAVLWFVVVVALIVVVWRSSRKKGRHGGVGTGAYGAVYDLLNEDKRKAVEIIVEEKAEARDPEDADGNMPDLAGSQPRKR